MVKRSVVDAPESDPSASAGAAGNPGAVVSIVMVNGADIDDTLPAVSVAFAVREWAPVDRLGLVSVQFPNASAVVVPSKAAPSYTATVALASAVPASTGVTLLVMLSDDELPVSLVEVRSGALGAMGEAVSTVMLSVEDEPDVLPARSVAVTVIECGPAVSVGVSVQLPDASAVTVPMSVAPVVHLHGGVGLGRAVENRAGDARDVVGR